MMALNKNLLWIRYFIKTNDKYSEDLDFTLLSEEIGNNKIFEWFTEVFKYILEEANIPLEIIDNNEHEDGGINFYISYIGP